MRSKLRHFYIKGEFDIEPFINMEVKFVPSILELVTMSEVTCGEQEGRLEEGTVVLAQNGHLGGVYRIIRNYWNLQELFSYPSPAVENQQLKGENARLMAQSESDGDRIAQLMKEVEELRSAQM